MKFNFATYSVSYSLISLHIFTVYLATFKRSPENVDDHGMLSNKTDERSTEKYAENKMLVRSLLGNA